MSLASTVGDGIGVRVAFGVEVGGGVLLGGGVTIITRGVGSGAIGSQAASRSSRTRAMDR